MNAPSSEVLTQAVLDEARHLLGDSVKKIRHCFAQVDNEQVWWRPDPTQNSIGNLVLHVDGNLRQWMLAGVGGAPDTRDRDAEFAERGPIPQDELLGRLEQTVREVEAVLANLTPDHLLEERHVQMFDVTVLGAIFHSLPHLVGHTHQIILLTRLQLGEAYRFEWTPASSGDDVPL